MAVDRDAVVVVEGDQLAQAQGAGQGTGFVGDAPSIRQPSPREGVGVVIDDGVVRLVELGQRLFGDGEADGIGDALAERAGGGLDAGGVAVFRGPAVRECIWRKFFRSSMDRS